MPIPKEPAAAADAMLAVSRVMTAILARSLVDVTPTVTVPQLRVLVMLSTRGEMNIGSVATALGVVPSNASRTCDRLVKADLVDRQEDPEDRRSVVLTLTRPGERLVSSMMQRRLDILGVIVSSMRAAERRELTRGCQAFMSALESQPPEGLALDAPLADVLPWLL